MLSRNVFDEIIKYLGILDMEMMDVWLEVVAIWLDVWWLWCLRCDSCDCLGFAI